MTGLFQKRVEFLFQKPQMVYYFLKLNRYLGFIEIAGIHVFRIIFVLFKEIHLHSP